MKVVIAGGTGSLGRSLAGSLVGDGHEVILLTRRPQPSLPFAQETWDGVGVGAWARHLGPDTGVVNLAGRLVDARPTRRTIEDLRRSRVAPTRALVEASRERPVAAWVQASTTAIWSDAGEARVTESSPLPTGEAALPQMTGVALPWEEALAGARAASLTTLRTSIVLQPGSPALERLVFLARIGAGGPVAGGAAWFSWISERDWVRLVRAGLGIDGPALPRLVVAAAPHPVRNRELMAALRRHFAPRPFGRPLGLPTPEALLRLGALALRTDPALALTGRHATSAALREAGFEFQDPRLGPLLASLG